MKNDRSGTNLRSKKAFVGISFQPIPYEANDHKAFRGTEIFSTGERV